MVSESLAFGRIVHCLPLAIVVLATIYFGCRTASSAGPPYSNSRVQNVGARDFLKTPLDPDASKFCASCPECPELTACPACSIPSVSEKECPTCAACPAASCLTCPAVTACPDAEANATTSTPEGPVNSVPTPAEISAAVQAFVNDFEVSEKIKPRSYSGIWDIETALHLLYQFYNFSHEPLSYIVDVGANQGGTLLRVLEVFGNLQESMYLQDYNDGKLEKKAPPSNFNAKFGVAPVPPVVSIEGSPKTFEILQYRADHYRWNASGNVQIVNFALAGKDGSVALGDSEGSEINSIVNTGGGTLVPARRLDTLLGLTPPSDPALNISLPILTNNFSRRACFLLKIDVEGWDVTVLKSGETLLSDKEKRPRFISFELHMRDGQGSLKQVVKWLFEHDYICFILGRENFMPLDDAWFPDKISNKLVGWRNAFCGLKHDRAVHSLVMFKNTLREPTAVFGRYLEQFITAGPASKS